MYTIYVEEMDKPVFVGHATAQFCMVGSGIFVGGKFYTVKSIELQQIAEVSRKCTH